MTDTQTKIAAVVLTKRDGPISLVSIDFVEGGILAVDEHARNARFFPWHAFSEVVLAFDTITDEPTDEPDLPKGHEGSE